MRFNSYRLAKQYQAEQSRAGKYAIIRETKNNGIRWYVVHVQDFDPDFDNYCQ